MKPYELGISPLGPSRRVKAAVRKAVKDINRRPGDAQERFERLLFSKFGVGRNNVLLANSLKELVYAIPLFLQPKNVLIVGPAVGLYGDAARAAGARVEFLRYGAEAGHIADHTASVEGSGFDMIFIANPNRIIGAAIEENALQELIERLSGGNGYVVIDEALIEFSGLKGFLERPFLQDNIIVLRTTACYYGLAGLELAYAVSSALVIEAMKRQSRWDLNLPAIVAAHTAMKDGTYRKLTSRFMETEKGLFKAALRGMEGVVLHDSDTNVLCFSSGKCLAEVARLAEGAGLAAEFSAAGSGIGAPCLRTSVMRHEHNLKFIRIMKKVCGEEPAEAVK
jgi:threonine-phosphate decarboxylase